MARPSNHQTPLGTETVEHQPKTAEGNAAMGTITYWREDGAWLGYWNDSPDYHTEGSTFEELKEMLVSLREDIREMIADGTMQDNRRNVAELAFA